MLPRPLLPLAVLAASTALAPRALSAPDPDAAASPALAGTPAAGAPGAPSQPARPPAPSPPQPSAPAPAPATSGERVDGLVTPAREPGDTARAAGSVLLYPPRRIVELLFLATGTAAGLVRDEQIVPRVEDLLSPRPGEISVFPFMFFQSGQVPSVGAKMLAVGQNIATSLAAGYGPWQDGLAEGRLRVATPRPLPSVFSLEALFDRRTQLSYLGVGQNPASDSRNHFNPGFEGGDAGYLEQRARIIASAGFRASNDVEIFLSSSFTHSRIDESPYGDVASLKDVFAPGTVPGIGSTGISYTELATRLDTREFVGRPSPGILLEGYGGVGKAVDSRMAYLRAGGRVAGYLPIVRRTNILSLRLTVDGEVPLSSEPIPFAWLVRQPDFRGIDDRRDKMSAVASIDYRWAFARFLAARVFVDGATVGAGPLDLFVGLPRPAFGLGLDLFSRSTDIGQVALSWSPEGVRFLLSFGLSTASDRQHRD
jgi:hypothetical protein